MRERRGLASDPTGRRRADRQEGINHETAVPRPAAPWPWAPTALTSLAAGHAFAQQAASQPADAGTIEVVGHRPGSARPPSRPPRSASARSPRSRCRRWAPRASRTISRTVPNLQVDGNSPTSRRLTLRGVRSAGEATVSASITTKPR
ncbi:hypothetical protein ACRAWD_18430 [Caulobacter segnis]